MRTTLLGLFLCLAACPRAGAPRAVSLDATIASLVPELTRKHGEAHRDRIARGLRQAAALWRAGDGGPEAFAAFARTHFLSSKGSLDLVFDRFQRHLEQLDGHFVELGRELRRHAEVETGPLLEVDKLFSAIDPGANLLEDLFRGKVAFVALLNFPLTTLAERVSQGAAWSRRQWAEARLAGRFYRRVPGDVQAAVAKASADADLYIAQYNLYMHHVLDAGGARLFPKGLRLISHWNLRDDLKAAYAQKDGLGRQRVIARLMARIVDQTIPKAVIDNPTVDWNPFTNEVRPAPPETIEKGAPPSAVDPAREPDTRYAHILATFRAARLADPYSPAVPTLIARRFEVEREIPEARFEALLLEILKSPLLPRIARVIEQRLGRKLEPFDIWYDGFRPRAKFPEKDLDEIVQKRYPTAEAFQRDLPDILQKLGFSAGRARYLADRIVVDPSRGAGHALGAGRREDKARLRTRVEAGGMNYKGYNIAIHELGHNVEQTFSLFDVDHTLLSGVPNTAFTEALAFVFQARDLELLGLAKPDEESRRLKALNELWMTYEIGGPGLVDMRVWRWMYRNPAATPAELREATLRIARDVWNEYYAPIFGARDVTLLGIYSHMVSNMLYLPDYALGHIIAVQIEEHLRGRSDFGAEFERMAKHGTVTPDLWMQNATGKPISPSVMIDAAAAALRAIEAK